MSEEIIQTLQAKPSKNTGYGVWNINERIRLCYGEEFGITFTSTINKGTCAWITIPIQDTLTAQPKQ